MNPKKAVLCKSVEKMCDSSDNSTGEDSMSESESDNNNIGQVEEDEEEDEVVRAIRAENQREPDHPPSITTEEFVTDICFHPCEDLIAVADIVGDVQFYKYSNKENSMIKSVELHTKSCRDIEFSEDGKLLFSTSKDKSIMLSDVDTLRLINFYEDAHQVPIYCLTVIDENIFATGDDDGTIKLWDKRINSQIYKTKKNDDYISDIVTNETKQFLLCSSGDGSLTTIDLQNRKVHMQTEEYEEELTCLQLFRHETKVCSGSSNGKLYLYNWGEFGWHSDAFPATKSAINALVPITENIVVIACEDGNLRAVHLFPHRHLGVVGQHDLSIENLDISNNGEFVASTSHNNDIKFWNIKYFEDIKGLNGKHRKSEKKKEMDNNLPSSSLVNRSSFFSGLC